MDVIKIEDTWYTASEIVAYKKRADEHDSVAALNSRLKERISERDDSLIKVREWFSNLDWTSGDATTIEKEFVSDLLEDIGLDRLSTTWSASVIIYATINGLEANNGTTARELIADNIEVNFGEDADIWIEDVHVNELEQEKS
jgi:hypothetical protein